MNRLLRISFSFLALLALIGGGIFVSGRDIALANFVINSWQGYKLTSGLVGYWSFDGQDMDLASSTREVFDRSGNNFHGDWKNHATTTTIGKIGQGIDFDGSNDFVSMGDIAALDMGDTADFSISGWFWRESSDTADTIIAKRNGFSATDVGYIMDISLSTDKIVFEVSDGTDEYSFSSADTFTETSNWGWNHFVAVFDQDSEPDTTIYINGRESLANNSGTIGNIGDLTNALPLQIGEQPDGDGPFNGKLDEIRIYNRALSADEAKRLYLMGASTKVNVSHRDELTANEAGGYWTFDGRDMDLSSSTAEVRGIEGNAFGDWKNHATTTRIGKIGQGIWFDGDDDYIDFGDSALYDIGDTVAFTMSGWFYRDDQSTADTIIFKRQGVIAAYPGYGVLIGAALDKLTFEVSDGTDEYSLDSVTTFKNPGWYHFAIVWDPNSAANTEIYINGVDDNAADTGTIANIGDLSNTRVLAIGAQSDGNNNFIGKLDEIRFYRRALSPDEIKRLYLMGRGQRAGLCGAGGISDADGNSYGIVQIGTQCWLDRNMNVGTRINDGTTQTDNATIEKYCYSNLNANCTNNHPNKPDGGLYQWDEAMQYSTTEGARGICPAGWHVPTDAEFYTLENYLKNDGEICTSGRLAEQCPPSGTKLRFGGSSSFEGNLAGDVDTGTSLNRDTRGYFWSSSSTAAAFARYVTDSASTTGRTLAPKDYGYSVRCIKDEL